jgi:hypothetical protein
VSPYQITQQLIALFSPRNVSVATWPDAPNEPLLSRIVAAPPPAGYFRHDLVAPFGLLAVEAFRAHDEHPADLIEEARWTLYLCAGNATQQAGSGAVVGGNRSSLGSSKGRGLLEVEPLVSQAIFDAVGLTARPRADGMRILSIPDELGGVVVMRPLSLVATRVPALSDYAPVRRLKSPTSTTLTWAAPPLRYDLVGYTWARASGGTAPATPAGGTFVPGTAASFAGGVTLTDSPGAGTFSYSIFWSYDATIDPYTGTGTVPIAPNRWSSQQSAQAGLVYLPASLTVTR